MENSKLATTGNFPVRQLENGVKARFDGKGDPWAQDHRVELGRSYNMQDIDGLFGQIAFAANTGERLFMEYVPDDYKNRLSSIRKFGVVALFDRKATERFAASENNRISLAFYLHICRIIAEKQPSGPKFFWVTGTCHPYEMIELNIRSGETISRTSLEKGKWSQVWRSVGLEEIRSGIIKWLSQ